MHTLCCSDGNDVMIALLYCIPGTWYHKKKTLVVSVITVNRALQDDFDHISWSLGVETAVLILGINPLNF